MEATHPARGPHAAIAPSDERQRLLLELFDALWDRYRRRVSYVATYERVVAAAGAVFVNDHIAFRTFACQSPSIGIHTLARVFEALGYRAAGCYDFADKHLSAVHFQHPHPQFPKLFISELKVWELSDAAQASVQRIVADHREPFPSLQLSALTKCATSSAADRVRMCTAVADLIESLPWTPPARSDVEALNQESQYAAWVAVHGYNVNHFTSLINSHQAPPLADIELTIRALQAAGVPMKAEIEGGPGSKLRQTATEAVTIPVAVRDQGQLTTMPWSYAYFELAERGQMADPATGESVRFEGFLGPQATQLFEMTRRKSYQ